MWAGRRGPRARACGPWRAAPRPLSPRWPPANSRWPQWPARWRAQWRHRARPASQTRPRRRTRAGAAADFVPDCAAPEAGTSGARRAACWARTPARGHAPRRPATRPALTPAVARVRRASASSNGRDRSWGWPHHGPEQGICPGPREDLALACRWLDRAARGIFGKIAESFELPRVVWVGSRPCSVESVAFGLQPPGSRESGNGAQTPSVPFRRA